MKLEKMCNKSHKLYVMSITKYKIYTPLIQYLPILASLEISRLTIQIQTQHCGILSWLLVKPTSFYSLI
jgi:hypothetical protein